MQNGASIIERDDNFEAKYPLSVYAEAARMIDQVTEKEEYLERAVKIVQERKRKPE
ncbi:DUF2958 domain-containing protein [Dyadobacter sp. 3J3]|uniref:DUF2958 domain-containing protein n=1 Tax=Dyadobacter sp. 3J3 TaxID=2606600 RepID=UPI00190F6009|nr:DUF2958 domain-containing protein [Dyadobacter sp. 3J3]